MEAAVEVVMREGVVRGRGLPRGEGEEAVVGEGVRGRRDGSNSSKGLLRGREGNCRGI
jgi:hypothetical protein